MIRLAVLVLGISLSIGPMGSPVWAQSDNNRLSSDFQTWYDASLKLNLRHGWELTTQYRVRFYNNAQDYRGSYFFLTGEKKINKYVNLLANYRLALIEGNAYHRFAIGFHAKYKLGRWTPLLRPTVQHQQQYFTGDDENSGNSSTYLRTRVGTKYHVAKHVDGYVYAEPFFSLSTPGLPVSFWQNSAGLSVDLSKHVGLTAYYIWQPEVHIQHPQTKHIAGLSLNAELKPSGGRKSKPIPQF